MILHFISGDRIDEAVEILALSFQNYPLMRYFLGSDDLNRISAFFRLSYQWRLALQSFWLSRNCQDST
ncbi:hypothetical protein Ple7327_3889 [Pleurocapsa sp. PCC 7327]|uniref:hypothetical protein n=1 Tax=Pleurocapsa sp. PCC 7327 TaxID=118163 RepID=UPI00029F83C3|nr:hypothetical protein [Pleurocapsa sp. PCC 7327]AFY79045.1 hypothetical protein Ple7327_3889 [Pleurocapsa sp. PCC 7327]